MVSKYQKCSLLLYQLLCQYRIHFQKCSLAHFKPQNLEHPKAAGFKKNAHSVNSKYFNFFKIVCKVPHRQALRTDTNTFITSEKQKNKSLSFFKKHIFVLGKYPRKELNMDMKKKKKTPQFLIYLKSQLSQEKLSQDHLSFSL